MNALVNIKIKMGALLLLALLLSVAGYAQPEETYEAYRTYQQKDLDKAAELIDKAITLEAGKKDALTWHIRGFIYKDMFNRQEGQKRNSEYRAEAVDAFFKSIKLDKKEEYLDNNVKSLRYLASSYYNDAVLVIRDQDKQTVDKSEEFYKAYKSIMEVSDNRFDPVDRDITYYKALATCYRKIYEQDRAANKLSLQKALQSYTYVLSLDPSDYGANYNTAINLYNEGAYSIEHIDSEAKIPTIVKVQAVSVELFREALPYMLKAYELDSTRRETLIGLRGIYLSLNDNEKAEKYKALLEHTQQTDK